MVRIVKAGAAFLLLFMILGSFIAWYPYAPYPGAIAPCKFHPGALLVQRMILGTLEKVGINPLSPPIDPPWLTRMAFDRLEHVLSAYISDHARLPCADEHYSQAGIMKGIPLYFGTSSSTNVLINGTLIPRNVAARGDIGVKGYQKRWAGPYVKMGPDSYDCSSPEEAEPAFFMTDAYGIPFRFEWVDQKLHLHSSGPDGIFDPISVAGSRGYEGNDQIKELKVFFTPPE